MTVTIIIITITITICYSPRKDGIGSCICAVIENHNNIHTDRTDQSIVETLRFIATMRALVDQSLARVHHRGGLHTHALNNTYYIG